MFLRQVSIPTVAGQVSGEAAIRLVLPARRDHKGGLERSCGIDTSVPLMKTQSQGSGGKISPQSCLICLDPKAQMLSVCSKGLL